MKVTNKKCPKCIFPNRRELIKTCRNAYRHVLDNAQLTGPKRLSTKEEFELGRMLARIWVATKDTK